MHMSISVSMHEYGDEHHHVHEQNKKIISKCVRNVSEWMQHPKNRGHLRWHGGIEGAEKGIIPRYGARTHLAHAECVHGVCTASDAAPQCSWL